MGNEPVGVPCRQVLVNCLCRRRNFFGLMGLTLLLGSIIMSSLKYNPQRVYSSLFTQYPINKSTDTPPERITYQNINYDNKDCIYPGICRAPPANDTVYFRYVRNASFYQKLNETVDLKRSTTHNESVVPNIVHVTWYGGPKRNTFLFHHLISLLSIRNVLKPTRILFWCDLIPEGTYYHQTRERVPEIVLVVRDPPTEIMGRPIKVPEHQSDIVRLEAILEFGGTYVDLDVLAVKSFQPLFRYDVTMGYETPDGLCNGIMVAKPWADFMKIWYKEYKTFNDKVWGYHSVQLPAKLAHKYPNLIHTEATSMNHPNPGESFALQYGASPFDWQNKNYAVHTWIRTQLIAHKLNAWSIRTWDCAAGEMFRYIYFGDKALIAPID
ncbi:uncharacterized protein [Haliotis cracherodii]|uniref:uncharacterized protein isoform X1 n=1 Tax=Haliotis cracherodii TaxID=6455 RepID=UPI0039EB2F27